MVRITLVVAGVVIAAAGTAFALSELASSPGNHAVHSTPEFLTSQLGASQPTAALVRTPAPHVTVRIAKDGLAVSHPDGAVALIGTTQSQKRWTPHSNGASRKTTFGAQAIVFDGKQQGAEEYLVVDKRQGTRTWRWRLDTNLTPRMTPAGLVGFADGHRITDSYIPAVKILDAGGHDVTPRGAAWKTVKRNGAWWLELSLNDRRLSLPYTIDPAVLRIIGTVATIGAVAGTTLTVTAPATLRAQDLLIIHFAQATGTAAPGCPAGWNIVMNSGGTSSGVFTTGLGSIECWKKAVAGDIGANVVLTRTSAIAAAAIITAYKGVDTSQVGTGVPGATSPIRQAATATTNPGFTTATTVTFPALSAVTAIASEEVIGFGARAANDNWTTATNYTRRTAAASGTTGVSIGVYDRNVAGAGTTVAAQATAAMTSNVRWQGFTFALTNDTTAPTNGLDTLATNPTGNAYQASAGSAIFFNSQRRRHAHTLRPVHGHAVGPGQRHLSGTRRERLDAHARDADDRARTSPRRRSPGHLQRRARPCRSPRPTRAATRRRTPSP